MRKTTKKSELRTKPATGNQGIEVIIYVDYVDGMARSICRRFSMDQFQMLVNSKPLSIENLTICREIVHNTCVQIARNPNPKLNIHEMFFLTYICYYSTIMDSIKKFPFGGVAVVAHLVELNESQTTIEFFDPYAFEKLTGEDFSILPYQVNDEVISQPLVIALQQDELNFLLYLVSMVNSNDHCLCNLSNNQIAEALQTTLPTINNEWVAITLGKFQYYNLIGFNIYGRDGYTWFRDIYLGETDWTFILSN